MAFGNFQSFFNELGSLFELHYHVNYKSLAKPMPQFEGWIHQNLIEIQET